MEWDRLLSGVELVPGKALSWLLEFSWVGAWKTDVERVA